METTDWISVKTPPAYPGWYEIRYCDELSAEDDRLYFDGAQWRYAPDGSTSFFGNGWKDDFWRGLSETSK